MCVCVRVCAYIISRRAEDLQIQFKVVGIIYFR